MKFSKQNFSKIFFFKIYKVCFSVKILSFLFKKFFVNLVKKRHAAWIEQFNQQFCQLVITSFDGETDPRVLLHHFKLVQIIHEKQMPGESKHMWDEILDICACYFPVEFEAELRIFRFLENSFLL